MSAAGLREAATGGGTYMMNKHLQATSKAMSVVSAVLNFDVVELWTQDAGRLTNVYIYCDEEVTKELPFVQTTETFYPDADKQRRHKISPQVHFLVIHSA
jgi:hypothetical protein